MTPVTRGKEWAGILASKVSPLKERANPPRKRHLLRSASYMDLQIAELHLEGGETSPWRKCLGQGWYRNCFVDFRNFAMNRERELGLDRRETG